MILLWGLLNIKFYDKYFSFLLFLLFSVAGAGAWPACRAVQPGAGGLALYGLLELVTTKQEKLAPEPSLALGACVRPTLLQTMRF